MDIEKIYSLLCEDISRIHYQLSMKEGLQWTFFGMVFIATGIEQLLLFPIGIATFGIFWVFIGLWLISKSINYFIYWKFIRIISNENINIYSIKQTDINHVLGTLMKIYSVVQFLQFINIPDIANDKSISKNIIENELKFLLLRIKELQSNISQSIDDQTLYLKSALADISSLDEKDNSLYQVSELQKARLDKQIEQFEELQRVLVKV